MDNHFITAEVVFLKQVEKDPHKCCLVIKTFKKKSVPCFDVQVQEVQKKDNRLNSKALLSK